MITKFTKSFQTLALNIYRVLSFMVLSSIIIGVLGYVSFLIFYLSNSSWAAPIVLSPTQERVLSFQPQVATLEANLLKLKVDLSTADNKYFEGVKSQIDIHKLILRLESAKKAEVGSLTSTAANISAVTKEKQIDIKETAKVLEAAKEMQKTVDAELGANLITKDQAQARKIAIQTSINSLSEARANLVLLQEQGRISRDSAITLKGQSSVSLDALQTAQSLVQLHTVLRQLETDTETAKQTIAQLSVSVPETERVLNTAKTSPYYLALRNPTPVLFVPYDNLRNAKVGAPVYDCFFQIFWCTKVGTVDKLFDAEEYARHPLFKTELKGRFVTVKFTKPGAEKSTVVFLGGRPLLL